MPRPPCHTCLLYFHPGGHVSLGLLISILRVAVALGLRARRSKRLLEVGNDIINVLGTDRDADEVLRNTTANLFLIRELLVGRGPRVDSQRLGVSDIGQVRDQLEAIDDLASCLSIALDAKGEHAAETSR